MLEKRPILDQKLGFILITLEKCHYFDFLNLFFKQPKKRFFFLEHHKTHFPGLYCQNTKRCNNCHFWTKIMGKCQFFDFFNFLFLQPRKAFFLLEYLKRHFSGLYCRKRCGGKMDNFGPKPWISLFGKMSVFLLFELLVFITLKVVSSFENIIKHIFPAYITKQSMAEKRPILDQNHALTPLEKCQYFDFLNSSFLEPRKAFFCSRISLNAFSWPILPNIIWWKNC